jgi:hypothetical protein
MDVALKDDTLLERGPGKAEGRHLMKRFTLPGMSFLTGCNEHIIGPVW